MIGKDDIKFYYSNLFRRTARRMSGYNQDQWDTLNHRTRSKWLDRAILFLQEILGDKDLHEFIKKHKDNDYYNPYMFYDFR